MHMMVFSLPLFLFIFFILSVVNTVVSGSRVSRRNRERLRDGNRNSIGDSPDTGKRPNLEGKVFRLAHRYGGRVTVSDVVIETGLGLKEAERFMDTLSDGLHVKIELDQDGVFVYEFPEIIARRIPFTAPLDESSPLQN